MAGTGAQVNESRPLLVFPTVAVGQTPTRRPTPIGSPQGPSPARQGERLTPQFEALRRAFDSGRVTASDETTETDPELIVVFEVAGSVDGFGRAVRDVSGLEFLAEMAADAAEPDADFAFVSSGEAEARPVPTTLYATLSNAEAAGQLVTLFQRWVADPDAAFPWGQTPLKRAFAHLRSVRRWSAEDRVRETGLLAAWSEEVQVVGGTNMARVEVELWFRGDATKRAAAQREVEDAIRGSGGDVISSCTISAVEYHAVLADLPYSEVDRVLSDGPEAIALLMAPSVMLVASADALTVEELEAADLPAPAVPALGGDEIPRVALLDGLPLTNHHSLAGRLLVDDPDALESSYTSAQQRQHGTAMASLLCHGDLHAPLSPLATPIYVRPILRPHDFLNEETLPPDQLLADLLHRAFRRMFVGEGGAGPQAPSVRVVNLSIADPRRVFVRRVSPVARLLDWLAVEYNVLILVSAGNHAAAIEVDASALGDVESLRAAAARSLKESARHRRLLSPSEAINAVTVGASHDDSAPGIDSTALIDVLSSGDVASYSAVGGGHRRSIKPDVLLPGGRQLFMNAPLDPTEDSATLIPARQTAAGPGLLVAAPAGPGNITGTGYTLGTSGATALASRLSVDLLTLIEDELPEIEAQHHPVLAKALLVHACAWGPGESALRQLVGGGRKETTSFFGHGSLDSTRVGTASRERVVIVAAGSVRSGERHAVRLPLPPAVGATTEWRRLTTTLAWFSPTNPRDQRYRMARLRLSVDGARLGADAAGADGYAVRRGTVQHEVLEGRRAIAVSPGETLDVNVDCRVDAGTLGSPVRFALAVTLEMAETVRVDLHEQVRSALEVQLRAQQRVGG